MQVQIFEMQEIIDKEQEKLEEQKQFYENEVRNNNDVEHEAQQLNLLNSKMRRELNELTQYLLLLSNQVITIETTVRLLPVLY